MMQRKDLQCIAGLIPEKAKVLDIGCNDGTLLKYLSEAKGVNGRGIEIQQAMVSHCVQQGLPVVQGDADKDLSYYPDACFDYVISSQMLQATKHPKEVMVEMLRIARHVIISIPNFGYWRNRYYLLVKGRMPVTETLQYQWYETPNIHFCTVKDFIVLCREIGCTIEKKIYLTDDNVASPYGGCDHLANMFAEKAVFLLQRNRS